MVDMMSAFDAVMNEGLLVEEAKKLMHSHSFLVGSTPQRW